MIAKLIFFFNRLGRDLSGAGLLAMTGLVTVDVILRRLFNAPVIFADEVSGYLLALVTMLGVGYTLQEDGHIQVTMLVDHLSPRVRALLRVGICLIGLVYTVILLALTGQVAWESLEQNSFSPTPSQLPLFPFQVVMPIGCLFLLLQLWVETVRAFRAFSSPHAANTVAKD